MRFAVLTALAPLLLASVLVLTLKAHAGDDGEEALLGGLPTSKHSLLDGIRQATKEGGVAISAKFEDEGKGLSLSVYVAGKGLGVKAEENVLEELAGSPTNAEWKPGTEVFEDVPHVARSAEQLTLMRLTPLSLGDVIATAERARKGTVFSVKPEFLSNKPVFHVRIAADGKAVDLILDLVTGAPIGKDG